MMNYEEGLTLLEEKFGNDKRQFDLFSNDCAQLR